MMNISQLYKTMFFALDYIYEKDWSVELRNFLSAANPFLFKDKQSADPAIYDEFVKFCEGRQYSNLAEASYEIVSEFLGSINPPLEAVFLANISQEEWNDVVLEED